jgi:putative DNA primase/helicase
MGAGKWMPEYNDALAGRDVVILPDNDKSGREHAAQVVAFLAGVAASVKVVELPGLAPKGDVSDWLEAGGTAAKLWELVEATAVLEAGPRMRSRPKGDNRSDADKVLRPRADRTPTAPDVSN